MFTRQVAVNTWLRHCTHITALSVRFTPLVQIRQYDISYFVCRTSCVQCGLSRYYDSLRTGLFGDRIPVGARFSTPVQTDPGAHSAPYRMVTGPFRGVKRPRRGVNHPLHLAPRLKKEYSYTWSFVCL